MENIYFSFKFKYLKQPKIFPMDSVQRQKQNKELLKKIGRYTTAAGAALLTGNLANANVHLTTTTINLNGNNDGDKVYYKVDFDGDGLGEISIGVSTSTFDSKARVWLTYGYDNGVTNYQHVENTSNYFSNADPAPLAMNKIIGPTLESSASWDGEHSDTIVSTESSSVDDGSFGYYPNETRYLGVRFTGDHGTNWYYGWVGLKIYSTPLNGGTVGQIINYAYEETPNTAILAGNAHAVPVLPIASAIGLGLAGLFGTIRNRRKKNNI
jgi:hypothetical protein